MPGYTQIADDITAKALELGFSACGFAPCEPLDGLNEDFHEWLAAGNAGDMGYLNKNVDIRLDPGKLVPEAKTIISLAAGYYFPLPEHQTGTPRISRYALGTDYHTVLKAKGRELLAWINKEYGPAAGRVFTDSAPLFEREWARRSGLGWIGKNGCLILPRQGSWYFLAEIVTNLEIIAEPVPVPNHCGSCNRCINACPTRALNGDGSMDPRKCISYLTIENHGDIPDEFHGKWNDWIFGCDICQDVCPWNHDPGTSILDELQPRVTLTGLSRDSVPAGEASFHRLFDGTPVSRAGCSGILRNFAFLEKDVT